MGKVGALLRHRCCTHKHDVSICVFGNERETLYKFASAELQTELYKSGILVNVKGAILQLRVLTDTEEEVSP